MGWIFIAIVLFFGSAMYMAYRWSSQLTYYHRLYMNWYREIENKEFEEMSKQRLTDKAKENILNFFSSKRNKEEWDGISTVFDFTRNKRGYALYSRLDEWNDEVRNENAQFSESSKKTNCISEVQQEEATSTNVNPPSVQQLTTQYKHLNTQSETENKENDERAAPLLKKS